MRSNADWHRFFVLLCECAALDPAALRLDRRFREAYDWVPQHAAPEVAVQHVLEMMPPEGLAASMLALHRTTPENTSVGSMESAEATDLASTTSVTPTNPRSKAEGKRKMPVAPPRPEKRATLWGNDKIGDDEPERRREERF